ncbi:MAG: dependent oxidoreductase [Alphaproteobacteria bacterium]|nr:dependent oxidoreductase [Alphaproteobacteria bacterium]
MTRRADIAVIGAGMAGASLAAELVGSASILLVEAEERPGYHSTGRSAAFWSESYGGPAIQPLTSASGPYLATRGFLRARGGLHIARGDGREALRSLESNHSGRVRFEPADRETMVRRIPGLKPGWDWGLAEPSCADIDVAGLHAYYLAQGRRDGVELVASARLLKAKRTGAGWRLDTTAGPIEADILVDAAGAWADEVARIAGASPLRIQPYRRTVAQLRVHPPAPPDLPLVIDALERFYFKPEAGGRIWLSPHDETASDPCDCAPDELDVALAIERLEQVVDWRVERVEHKWAGLRSFAPDRLPVYGFDPRVDGFFWFAGQGGFGIQTAPAAARLGAALLLGREPDGMVRAIEAGAYSPARFG